MGQVTWRPSDADRCPARVNPVLRHPAERFASFDGPWRFRLDPDDVGVKRAWFRRPGAIKQTVRVPGCWQGQGFGHDGTDAIWDFRIDTRVFRATYKGTGWYARPFRVPDDWEGGRLWLALGGVHPTADVWVNGHALGTHCGPFVPFAFDVTDHVRAGKDNVLVVRVHEADRWLGLAYNWAGNWSGLFRGVELQHTGACWLDRLEVLPDVARGCLHVRVVVGGAGPRPMTVSVSAGPADGDPTDHTRHRIAGPGPYALDLPVRSPRLWSPDEPNLYRVDVGLHQGDRVLDARSERVGFVTLGTRGKQFLINGEPYYMRGTGEFAICPETGSPDTCRQRWRKKLRTLRDYGYNYVRCQSYVPAPEYYDAADEVGLIVQSEMGMLGAWGGQSPWHRYAWPAPTPAFRDALRWQWNRTVRRDVNHPAAAIYCMSNELGSDTLFPGVAHRCSRETKAIKPGAMVIWTDGGYHKDLPGDFVNADARLDAETDVPVIQHEFRWWSSYPDVRIEGQYTGAVRPYAIAIAREAARRHRLTRLLPQMAHVSQQLQYVEARTKMEACRRDHRRLAGICHFSGADSGLSPQGIMGEFYQRKLVDGVTWGRTNGDTVILMDRDFDRRVLAGGQTLRCKLSVSDFAHPPMERPVLEWKLVAGRRTLRAGRCTFRHRPFCTCPAGTVTVDLPDVGRPQVLILHAVLREGKRTVRNAWPFWVLPCECELPNGVVVYGRAGHTWLRTVKSLPRVSVLPGPDGARNLLPTGPEGCFAQKVPGTVPPRAVLAETLDLTLAQYMRAGGRVVLAAPEGLLRPFAPKLGAGGYYFLPPANYPPLEDGHSGTIIADHPMLGELPHEGFADMQLYRPISESPPVDLAPLGLGRVDPVIRVLSTYFTCVPLAYLVELAFGKGGLVLCALGLDQKWPEARYLLGAMLRHAAGRSFRPKARLSAASLKRLTEACLLTDR